MMKLADFVIGQEFWCGGRQWRCTDIGTRTIVAIRLERRRTLGRAEAEAEGWFNGPPYAVAETVFDEYHQEGCSITPDDEA
jgi:hypothetical protein